MSRHVARVLTIRLDYGFNLDRKDGEKASQVHFSVGAPF